MQLRDLLELVFVCLSSVLCARNCFRMTPARHSPQNREHDAGAKTEGAQGVADESLGTASIQAAEFMWCGGRGDGPAWLVGAAQGGEVRRAEQRC